MCGVISIEVPFINTQWIKVGVNRNVFAEILMFIDKLLLCDFFSTPFVYLPIYSEGSARFICWRFQNKGRECLPCYCVVPH